MLTLSQTFIQQDQSHTDSLLKSMFSLDLYFPTRPHTYRNEQVRMWIPSKTSKWATVSLRGQPYLCHAVNVWNWEFSSGLSTKMARFRKWSCLPHLNYNVLQIQTGSLFILLLSFALVENASIRRGHATRHTEIWMEINFLHRHVGTSVSF